MSDQLTVITTYRPAPSAGRSVARPAARAASARSASARPVSARSAAARPAVGSAGRALQPFDGHGVARRRPAAFYQERASQWGGLISTAFEAISSQAMYDLRARIQQLGKEAQDHIEEIDPGRTGAELKAWLDARLVADQQHHRAGVVSGVREFSDRAAQHFALTRSVPVDPPSSRLGSDFDTERLAVSKKKNSALSTSINIGMRAYMGFMIFFVLTQVMEFHAPGWVGVLPVLLLGGVALSEERRKRIDQRRYQASEAVAQHIGEFADRAARETEELLRGLEVGIGSAYRGRVEALMANAN
jgi:hypothetical protein